MCTGTASIPIRDCPDRTACGPFKVVPDEKFLSEKDEIWYTATRDTWEHTKIRIIRLLWIGAEKFAAEEVPCFMSPGVVWKYHDIFLSTFDRINGMDYEIPVTSGQKSCHTGIIKTTGGYRYILHFTPMVNRVLGENWISAYAHTTLYRVIHVLFLGFCTRYVLGKMREIPV